MKDYSTGLYFKNEEELIKAIKLLDRNGIEVNSNFTYSSLCFCEAKSLIGEDCGGTLIKSDGTPVDDIEDCIYELSEALYRVDNLIDAYVREEVFSEWLNENGLKFLS